MKKIYAITTLLAVAACASTAQAGVITPEQALARAYAGDQSAPRHIRGAQSSLTLTATGSVDSTPCYYVFSSADKGYMVLSADDAFPAVLGYSDSGSVLSAADMPDNMRAWLQSYSDQMAWARAHGAANAPAKVASRPQRASISPLCTTMWNQDAPYNNLCPTVSGTRCVTGCVATATAQVLKYHNYPTKGTGTYSYTWNRTTLSFDYGNTTFDWANMLDSYDSHATDAQRNAVATLMLACGVGVDMSYTTQQSGASSFRIAASLINNFGYDKAARYLMRDYYGLYEWEDLVYDQLKNVGPVQYSGQSSEGGHSFVCDGYSTDGYFHINWGWGGMSDGYFLLTALSPESQGIGGTTSGYNYGQDIIAGVQPPKAGSKLYENFCFGGDFSINQTTVTLGQMARVNGPAYNYSAGNITITLGLKVTDANGGVQYLASDNSREFQPLYGVNYYTVKLPANLAEGVYTVSPAFRGSDGTWHDAPVKVSCAKYEIMTVQGGVARFTAPEPALVTVTGLDLTTPLYIGSNFRIKATAVNNSDSEFYGTINVGLVNSLNKLVALGEAYAVDLMPGESTPMDYISTLTATSSALTAGNYKMAFFYSSDGNSYAQVSEAINVQLQAAPSRTSVGISSIKMLDGVTTDVDKDNVGVTFTLRCTAGYFASTVDLAIFPESGGTSLMVFPSEPIFISAGESQEHTIKGVFGVGEPGKSYMAAVFSGQRQLSNPVFFTLKAEDGVADINADATTVAVYPNPATDFVSVSAPAGVASAKVVSLAGAVVAEGADTVDVSTLAPGIYLVTVTDANGAVTTHRLVKK